MSTTKPSPAQHRALRAAAEGRLRSRWAGVSRLEMWVQSAKDPDVPIGGLTVNSLLRLGWVGLPVSDTPGSRMVLLTAAGRAALNLLETGQ